MSLDNTEATVSSINLHHITVQPFYFINMPVFSQGLLNNRETISSKDDGLTVLKKGHFWLISMEIISQKDSESLNATYIKIKPKGCSLINIKKSAGNVLKGAKQKS